MCYRLFEYKQKKRRRNIEAWRKLKALSTSKEKSQPNTERRKKKKERYEELW